MRTTTILICLLCSVSFSQDDVQPDDFRILNGKSYDLRSYEVPPPWTRIEGKILSVTTEGVLVAREGNWDSPIIFLRNAPLVGPYDGQTVSRVAALVGTYTYRSAGGAKKTVPEFDWGKLDAKRYADFLATREQAKQRLILSRDAEIASRSAKQKAERQAAEERAAKFHEERASKGSESSQFEIGLRYLDGRGVEKNRETALRWLTMAAEAGHEPAKKKLADIAAEAK